MLENSPFRPYLIEKYTLLQRIAGSLGCSVSDLAKPTPSDLIATDELLRLWSMIGHAQDRAKVLAFIRNAVSVEPSKEAAE
jgi:hypothetical protein